MAGWARRRRALRRRFNPYVVGAPVFDDQLFFGREPLERRTLQALQSGNVHLTGERRIGKTSFLHHLERSLAARTAGPFRHFAVFVDLEAVADAGVLRTLFEETVEATGAVAAMSDSLRRLAGGGAYHAEVFDRDLRRLIAELGASAARPVRLVLLIDEADAPCGSLDRARNGWLAPLLRSASPQLRMVLAAARSHEGPESDGGLPLERVELEPLTPADAEALVTRPVAGFFRYEPRAVERILVQSRLRPYEIQRRCRRAVDRMLDACRTTVCLSDVEALP
jgi:hypothetical protein